MRVVLLCVFLPFVGALIGYTTKWLALKMMFGPAEFRGIGPIGWQGIIQRRSPILALGVADVVEHGGIDVDLILGQLDAADIADHVGNAFDPHAATLGAAAANAVEPGLWVLLDGDQRASVERTIRTDSRNAVEAIVRDVAPQLAERLDIRKNVVGTMSADNGEIMARLITTVGASGLRLIIWYGAVLGGLIGAVQIGLYLTFEEWWLMPIVGAFDGVINNWLAIQMIFRPREPYLLLGRFRIQGMFPARQQEIASDYAGIVADEVLTPRRLGAALLEGDGAADLIPLALRHLDRAMAPTASLVADFAGRTAEPEVRSAVAASIGTSVMTLAPALGDSLEAHLAKALDLRGTLEAAIQAMDKETFEEILIKALEEDKKLVVVIGGFLGAIIGTIQAGLVLGLGG